MREELRPDPTAEQLARWDRLAAVLKHYGAPSRLVYHAAGGRFDRFSSKRANHHSYNLIG
jgi:hypothetical protein